MNKRWVANYLTGIPEYVDQVDKTLNDLFDDVCLSYGERKSLTCHGYSLTFKQVADYVNNLAAQLAAIGCKKGDKIAIAMPNLIQYPIAIFAILKIGAVVVNINPLYTESEMEYILQNSEAQSIIILDVIASKLNNIRNSTGLKNIIVTEIADLYPWYSRIIFPLVLKYVKHLDTSYTYSAHNFADMVRTPADLNIQFGKVLVGDLAFLQYTGATTGKPKGAMLTHQNVVSNVIQIRYWLEAQISDLSKQISISALPLYHIFSLTANLFTTFLAGGETVMITNPRDVVDTVKILSKSNFTVFNGLDTLYNHLLNYPNFSELDFSTYKYSVAGGMPAMKVVADKWKSVTGVTLCNCYGLTESSPAVTMNFFADQFDGSVGYPLPSTEVVIRDPDTLAELDVGQTGVVWIKGPQVMSAYWNNPEKTNSVFDDGWFNTHDLGYLDERGKLFINGRQTDMVIVSGFNVYPVEIEDVMLQINEVSEVAVVGTPDEATGEKLVAFVVFKPGLYTTNDAMINYCKKYLAGYKVPHSILVVEQLPKTLVGKVDKLAIVKQFLTKGYLK